MKSKKSDFIVEGPGEKIKLEPSDHSEAATRKRSKWIKWLLNIIETIVTALT